MIGISLAQPQCSKLAKDDDALLDMGHPYLTVFGVLLCNHTPVKEGCQQTNHTI